jgi:hypothetical protein
MFAASTALARRAVFSASAAAALGGLALLAGSGPALPTVGVTPPAEGAVPTAREILGPAAVVPLEKEPPAKIVVDAPLPDQLARGRVVVQYRTENLRVLPVFGEAALAISPRVGHLHVSVDGNRWVWGVWYGTNGGELVLGGFDPGPHTILIELVDANHKTLAKGVVKFDVPRPPDPKADGERPAPDASKQAPAKLVVDRPDADSLAKGLALIHYRAENVQLVPVYGPAAAAVSPRVGHVHVTVDGNPWHWADATGQPVVVAGLPPGPHTVLIELAGADHTVLAKEVVKFDVPRR